MKKLIQAVFLAWAFAASALAVDTAVAQVIHIDVDARGLVAVEGKPVAIEILSATVSSAIHDKEYVAVELKVPENLDKAKVDQVMNACRKAGISRFSTVRKPAAKS